MYLFTYILTLFTNLITIPNKFVAYKYFSSFWQQKYYLLNPPLQTKISIIYSNNRAKNILSTLETNSSINRIQENVFGIIISLVGNASKALIFFPY